MTETYDPDYNESHHYDDRDMEMSDDAPRGTYPPIVERPENTHMGYGGRDPAIE